MTKHVRPPEKFTRQNIFLNKYKFFIMSDCFCHTPSIIFAPRLKKRSKSILIIYHDGKQEHDFRKDDEHE